MRKELDTKNNGETCEFEFIEPKNFSRFLGKSGYRPLYLMTNTRNQLPHNKSELLLITKFSLLCSIPKAYKAAGEASSTL